MSGAGASILATDGRDILSEGFAYLLDEKETPAMAKSESSIEVQVDRTGKDSSSVRWVAVAVSGGCSIEVACRDGIAVVRLSVADNGVCLSADGPQSDFIRAINLLSLHLPRCRA